MTQVFKPEKQAAQATKKSPYAPTKLKHLHYMNIYHEQLSNLKNRDAVLLELGVAAGESLKYWCDYLPKARIVGIDIQPVQIDDPTGRIRFYTGEQQDRAMLDKIAAAEAPEGFDVIIDDG